jgi:hypothetical protein
MKFRGVILPRGMTRRISRARARARLKYHASFCYVGSVTWIEENSIALMDVRRPAFLGRNDKMTRMRADAKYALLALAHSRVDAILSRSSIA